MSDNKALDDLTADLREINSKDSKEAAAWAFDRAMQVIGISDDRGLGVQLGRFIANHDFVTGGEGDGTQPAYHNSQHGAQVALAAAHLAKAEYGDDPEALRQNGLHLVIAGLGHDLQHPGRGNQSFRELEWKSFRCLSEIMDQFRYDWEQERGHRPVTDAAWRRMEDIYGELIVHTEFSKDAKENAQAYQEGKELPSNLTSLKLLLNEADILGSSLAPIGPELGRKFAAEENKPFLGEWKSRAGFLEFAAKPLFITEAAKKLGLPEHIQGQIDAIKTLTPEKLDAITKENPAKADALVVEQLKNKVAVLTAETATVSPVIAPFIAPVAPVQNLDGIDRVASRLDTLRQSSAPALGRSGPKP